MTITITIEMGNDAFFENEGPETARILRKAADRLEGHDKFDESQGFKLFDYNGNKVGTVEVRE